MILAEPYVAARRLTDLPNINTEIASKLHKIGIRETEDFLSRDPYAIFEVMLQKIDPSMGKRDLASLVGAQQGCRWNNVLTEVTREYRMRQPKQRLQR